MTTPKWQTPKDLGVLENNSYFEKELIATSDISDLYYYVVSGRLPSGVQLNIDGTLVGVPSVLSTESGERNYLSKFTVRAQDSEGSVTDRTFSVLISGIQPPTIYTTTANLGTYEDGSYFNYQLAGEDPNPASNLTWSLVRGMIPPGITLSKSGVLEGFFYQNVVSEAAYNVRGWDKTSWDKFIYDYTRRQQDLDYEFTIELSDGINYSRQNYIIRVIGRNSLTADTTATNTDNTWVNIDVAPYHLPFISTMPQRLPEIKPELTRQGTNFAFKFDAVDFDEDDIYFEISSMDRLGFDQDGDEINHIHGTGFDMDGFDESEHPMPLYLGINNHTGWYTGHIAPQVEHQVDYEFQVYARKRIDFTKQGHRSTFVVSVLGQVDESITWITDSDLGSIENGTVSGIKLEARSSTNTELIYKIKPDSRSRTPQGIILLSNGMLSGRSTTEFFQLDGGDTTLDGNRTTFEKVCTFTVVAQTPNKSAYSERTFTLAIKQVNKKPFENLYLKGFPTADQRMLFASIMNNQELFPDPLIYRINDPWFGKSQDLRFLFLPGINPTSLPDYVAAMGRNHYTKSVLFGDVKTAVALDEKYNVVYEVVYLDVIDEQEGRDPVTGKPAAPAQSILLNNANPYYDENGVPYYEVTPNALGNMSTQIEEVIGIANPNALPQWMTCPQLDPNNPNEYTVPLGYTRAVVLAYTVPGASKLIAYRLKNANFSFNRIPFKTDRYQLDNYLSKHYNIDLQQYLNGEETAIDRAPSVAEAYRYKGDVTVAVDCSISDISGKHINTVRQELLMDSYNDFGDGDTLIFMKPSVLVDVPGYLEYLLLGASNRKAGIYRINVHPTTYIVSLSYLSDTIPGDIVNIKHGSLYGGKTFAFEAYLKHGPIPLWWEFTKTPAYDPVTGTYLLEPHKQTSFDQGATRFVSNKNQYAGPETDAKYIKFPKYGVFI